MRIIHCATIVATLVLTGQTWAATTELPASLAGAPGTASNRGFLVRSAQAPFEAAVNHNSLRAIRQLHGTLTDEAGAPIPDEAIAGPEAGGL